MSSSESVIGIGIETRTDASSISGLTQALTQLNTTISGLNEILSRHVSATQAITEAMKVFQSAGKDGVELSYKLSDAYNRIGVTTKEADESMVRSVATLLNKKQVSKDLVEVETEVQKAAAALADSVEKELKVTEQETKAVVQNTQLVKEQESAMMTAKEMWDSLGASEERETQQLRENTVAEEQNQTTKKRRGTQTNPQYNLMDWGKFPGEEGGAGEGVNENAAAWLRLNKALEDGTKASGDAMRSLGVLQALMAEGADPVKQLSAFNQELLERLKALNPETVTLSQIRRVLQGVTLEQIQAEQGLNEVSMQDVTAVTNQLKTVGELSMARQFLNEVLASGNLTETQKVQIGTQVAKIEQEEQKILQNKVNEEISLAEKEAKRLVTTGDLAGAITQLTSIQNTYNLSAKESADIDIQIQALKNKQEAQLAKENSEEVQLLQTKARGAMQAKDYAEAINLLTQARDKAIAGGNQQAQVENQLADAMRKSETAANGAAGGIHNQWSSSFVLFGASMLVNSAIQQIALTTEEKANPALQHMGRIMQEMSSGGMMAMMMFPAAGPAGMAIGALAGAVLGLGIAITSVSPEINALNKQLDSWAKQDDLSKTLVGLYGVTKSEADAMLEVAKGSKEAASALRDGVEASRDMNVVQKVLFVEQTGLNNMWRDFSGLLGTLPLDILPNLSRQVDQVRASQKAAADAAYEHARALKELEDSAKAASKEASKAFAEINNVVSETGKKASDMMKENNEDARKANRDYNQDIAKDARTLSDTLSDIQQDRGRQWKKYLDDQKETYHKYITDQEKAFSDRADKEADAHQVLKDKLADLRWSHLKDENVASDELVKKRQDTANKILSIEREMRQDIADLDYNASINMAKAKTEREREQIEFSTAYERSKIMQSASSKIADAQKTLADYETEEAKKRKLTDDTYQHNIDIANREYNQKVEIAEREYKQKTRILDDQYRDDTKKLQDNLTAQSLLLDDEAAKAKKRYEEQVADRKLQLANEVFDTVKATMDKALAMKTEITASILMYNNLHTAALQAIQDVKDMKDEMTEDLSGAPRYSLMYVIPNLLSAMGLPSYGVNLSGIPGRANGGSVDSGMPYIVGERGPELFVPKSSGTVLSNNYNTGGNTFNIVSNNAEEVWQFIRGKLELSSWQ